MGARSRLASTLTRAAKAIGGPQDGAPSLPQQMRDAARDVSQMGPQQPFSPGEPISPYDGYSRQPRQHNFPTSYNVATRPRTHERVSFETLKGLINAYDIASSCIWHRIDSIRSLNWKLISADGYSGDVTDAIPAGMRVLKSPDHKHSFKTWLAKYLYDILAYDAGTLYRMRNRAGRCIGLKPIDGTLIAPLLDYWGDSPEAPAEAYVQYANGLPWNWLTRDDLIYEPYRPHTDSPYGHAPIESIILNANTDLRFQVYFLQRFTDGNVPEAFASAPETWSPEQVEQWQANWDTMMYGDQAAKHQIRWLPGGSTFTWSNEKDFSDVFSLFLLRKTCSVFHVTPADMGFTENVNRSSGESQADVQHRVGDLPLMEHVEGILSAFLAEDLGLPLKFEFDRGEEQDDQLNVAQSDDIYAKLGVVGVSELREMRFGLHEPAGQPVPRFIYTDRGGPIPLASLEAVAGEIDQQTGAPVPGSELPHTVFSEVEGVRPETPIRTTPLAVQEYGPGALPPKPPPQPDPVAKEDSGAPTTGITSETGITGYDLIGRDDDEDEEDRAAVVAKEMAAFRRFGKARKRSGEWRDFEFRAVPPGTARRLNAAGRVAVAKSPAGYSLSPRSAMISLDLPPGLIEAVPGGVDDHHVTVVYLGPDVDDAAFAVACRRAQAAAAAMPGPLTGSLAGVASFPPSAGSDGKVPAYVPAALPGAVPLRAALADLSASEHADWKPHVTLAYLGEGAPLPAPLPSTPVTFTHLSVHRGDDVERFRLGGVPLGGCCGGSAGCQCGPAEVAKAGDGQGPKELSSAKAWPGWDRDQELAALYATLIAQALAGAVDVSALAAAWFALHPEAAAGGTAALGGGASAGAAAGPLLGPVGEAIAEALGPVLRDLWAEGWVLGQQSAQAVLTGTAVDWAGWTPADVAAADQIAGAGPQRLLADADVMITSIAQDRIGELADVLEASLRSGVLEIEPYHKPAGAGSMQAELPPRNSASDLAAKLEKVLDNPNYAQITAHDLMARAQSAASVQSYRETGVREKSWLVAPGPCPVCEANAAEGAIPLDQAFSSGDQSPPAHYRCRCAPMPVVR